MAPWTERLRRNMDAPSAPWQEKASPTFGFSDEFQDAFHGECIPWESEGSRNMSPSRPHIYASEVLVETVVRLPRGHDAHCENDDLEMNEEGCHAIRKEEVAKNEGSVKEEEEEAEVEEMEDESEEENLAKSDDLGDVDEDEILDEQQSPEWRNSEHLLTNLRESNFTEGEDTEDIDEQAENEESEDATRGDWMSVTMLYESEGTISASDRSHDIPTEGQEMSSPISSTSPLHRSSISNSSRQDDAETLFEQPAAFNTSGATGAGIGAANSPVLLGRENFLAAASPMFLEARDWPQERRPQQPRRGRTGLFQCALCRIGEFRRSVGEVLRSVPACLRGRQTPSSHLGIASASQQHLQRNQQHQSEEKCQLRDSAGGPRVAPASTKAGRCTVCLERPSEVAFVPCGHRCICLECATALPEAVRRRCPTCRSTTFGLLRVFD
eukprot:TRINITY_DN40874_c0_g1_i1.p1 TRINITY_DN40874_c0_g1~~TRINITY_DN40874_c0_g1_i1.p1  ORF type:complete len:510 (+),score=87.90 TRINITY_DN40874_c0_g1_i1:212-1531(+)